MVLERAEARDHPRKEDDDEVCLVVLAAGVTQRKDLVGGRGQAHHASLVQGLRLVDVAERQLELVLGAEHCQARSSRSTASSSVSIATSFAFAEKSGGSYLVGQAS